MSFVVPELVEPVKAFATALGIGLLIGMERERRPDSAAGLRTFSLVAMLGCLFALLDERSGSTWMLAVGLLVIAVRYASFWLGGAMLLYAAQFSLHAFYMVMSRSVDLLHMRINNLNFLGISVCLAVGTIVGWRRRVVSRRSAA